MADVSMEQNLSINALLISLSQHFPSMRVTVTNLGCARVDDHGGIQFLQKPTVTEIDLKEIRAKRPELPMPSDVSQAVKLGAVRDLRRR